MKIEINCPYCQDGTKLNCLIDVEGDPSVGMQPVGLENVEGECVHAVAINDDIDTCDADRIPIFWPTFMRNVNEKIDEGYRLQREWEESSNDEPDTC